MAYASWSVSFGEQPSAAKWNILGTNDASFNDGTGIAGLYKDLLSVDSNPYKFRGYRSAALSTASGTNTAIPFDAETFDTNSNFDIATNKGRYTAPVSGYYSFSGAFGIINIAGYMQISLWVNGSIYSNGGQLYYTNANNNFVTFSGLVYLTAGQYAELYYYTDGVKTVVVGTSNCHFSGFLVSRT